MPIVKRTLSADTINDFSKRSINTMFYEEGNLLILQWCSNHPWMTFFIILAIIGSVTKIIGYIASTINNV